MKIKNIMKQGRDVIYPSWILDSVAAGQMLPLTRK